MFLNDPAVRMANPSFRVTLLRVRRAHPFEPAAWHDPTGSQPARDPVEARAEAPSIGAALRPAAFDIGRTRSTPHACTAIWPERFYDIRVAVFPRHSFATLA